VNKSIHVRIFVHTEHAIVQYDKFHMFQDIYVYKQALHRKVLDMDVVLIPMAMKQYDMEHQLHDHKEVV
jgi:hypothetical protein